MIGKLRTIAKKTTIALIFVWLFCLFCGCGQTKIVPVPETKTETKIEYRDRFVHDTTFVHEKETVYTKADTVFKDRIKYKYVEHTRIDTAYVDRCRVDSIPYKVEVEKRLTHWQNFKVEYGGIAIGALLAILAIVVSLYILPFIRRR